MPAHSVPYARWRIVAAFLLAPLVGSFAFACWEPAYLGLDSLIERILRTMVIVAIIGGYPATLIFGVPAFFILRHLVRASALNCASTGLLVASVPWLLLVLLSNPQEAYSGGHVTVHDGWKTWWGWLDALEIVGQAAAFGALSGLVFWLLAVAGSGRRG